MSKITREQAKDLRNAFQCWQQDYDPVEDKEQYDMFGLGMMAMDALLASLEAKPVAYLTNSASMTEVITSHHFGGDSVSMRRVAESSKWKPLFTTPPAPVSVPDEVNVLLNHLEDVLPDEAFNLIDVKTWNNVSMLSRPDVYRDAMLQGADGNSPVIPDGWVILPAEPTQAMMNAWLSEVANWRGHAAGYRAMIAAAPQQE